VIDPDFPFADLKVLDLSQGVAGPSCALHFAQLGATVVKVEPPEGDWARGHGIVNGSQSVCYAVANRGKKCVVLNMRDPEARALVRRMAVEADVLVSNYRPGVNKRLGLDYESLVKDNPKLIYVSVTGFGNDGPASDLPATDTIIQSFSGMVAVNKGRDGKPHKIEAILVDLSTGLYAFNAAAVALYVRAKGGPQGRYIDAPLVRAAATFQPVKVAEYAVTNGHPPVHTTSPVETYETRNGLLTVVCIRDRDYQALCKVIGRDDLATDPKYLTVQSRLAHDEELKVQIRPILATKTTEEWVKLFKEVDVLHQRINNYGDFLSHPQVQHLSLFTTVAQPGIGRMPVPNPIGAVPVGANDPRGIAPALGENTRDVLAALGLDKAAIEDLIKRGIAMTDDAEKAARAKAG